MTDAGYFLQSERHLFAVVWVVRDPASGAHVGRLEYCQFEQQAHDLRQAVEMRYSRRDGPELLHVAIAHNTARRIPRKVLP